MKKGIKEYLVCVLVCFWICAIFIGLVCCISYFPKLNQAFANSTGGNPRPWKETKKILMVRLPLTIPACFLAGLMMFVSCKDFGEEDNDEEDDDEEEN